MINHNRRTFLATLAGLPVLGSIRGDLSMKSGALRTGILKTSLNAFSFNAPLLAGTMTIDDMLDFCAETGFEGVDITGYYFKGYPAVPTDEYLYHVKRKAFQLGVSISGTGVRNDFTYIEESKRQPEIELVKKWIEVAAKLGAPVIRVFAGAQKNAANTEDQVTQLMVRDLLICAEYGKEHGVVVGLQNHNDFIQTAAQVNKIIESVNSEWLGLILDTGSYRVHDPYSEIADSVKHAVNWQIKEKIFVKGAEQETDIAKLMGIIKASTYSGYLPIETLGEGDPKLKIRTLFQKLKANL